jgi:hypothetical protein
MLILLAMLTQAAPALDADPVQAALTCRSATVTGLESLPLETSMQFTYFTMSAARALPGGENYFQRMAAVPASNSAPGVNLESAPQLRESCDQRFPLARRTGPVTLPAGALERDLMCAGVTTVIAGVARGYRDRTGDAAPFGRLQAIAARYQARAAAAMMERGMTTSDAQRRALGEQIFASLDIGNGASIADACEALPPSG